MGTRGPTARPLQSAPEGVGQGDEWLEPADDEQLEDLSPEERGAKKAATGDVAEFVAKTAPGGNAQWKRLEASAIGAARGEVEAQRQSYADEGLTMVGRPRVVKTSVRSIDASSSPRTVVLDVCIDSSKVDVLDQNGRSVGERLYRPDGAVLHVYELTEGDGGWQVSRHAIPADSTCDKGTEDQ